MTWHIIRRYRVVLHREIGNLLPIFKAFRQGCNIITIQIERHKIGHSLKSIWQRSQFIKTKVNIVYRLELGECIGQSNQYYPRDPNLLGEITLILSDSSTRLLLDKSISLIRKLTDDFWKLVELVVWKVEVFDQCQFSKPIWQCFELISP